MILATRASMKNFPIPDGIVSRSQEALHVGDVVGTRKMSGQRTYLMALELSTAVILVHRRAHPFARSSVWVSPPISSRISPSTVIPLYF